jgi:hypothetical protein
MTHMRIRSSDTYDRRAHHASYAGESLAQPCLGFLFAERRVPTPTAVPRPPDFYSVKDTLTPKYLTASERDLTGAEGDFGSNA